MSRYKSYQRNEETGVLEVDMVEDLIELPFHQKVDYFVSDVFGGVHRVRKLENLKTHYVCIPHGTLATYDDDKLTRIVVASHRYGLRAEITNHGMRGLKILLHNRTQRSGRLYERHPNMAEVMETMVTE